MTLGAGTGTLLFPPWLWGAGESPKALPTKKQGAKVRAAFLYPPSKTFASKPDGWWSWPGNEFDAEGRQKKFVAALREMEQRLDMKIAVDPEPIANADAAQRLASEMQSERPDGLLLVMFYNGSLAIADLLLKAAEEAGIPAIFYIGLGVKHGSVAQYRRPGLYFIQSLDNLDAIECGLRMVNTKKRLSQTCLLSITEAQETREVVEAFFGITVRVIPFARYAEEFGKLSLG
ncbi:MAG: hypothetical protein FJ272_02635, partial [Planctomycetes bacterium]|nr:hypothetical protein [Planctomycetota bacterium]